jgi:modulator of FtsH protease HflC
MKRNSLTFAIGILLMLVFGALLFCFQVRQTDIALVTTFGKPTSAINTNALNPEPGPYFKWPWPIQKVQRFDKRIQNLESKFEETYTADKINVIVTIYTGWAISDPALFRERFGDSKERAATALESVVRQWNNAVVGKHTFANFISTDEQQLQLSQIEGEILAKVQPDAKAYGIDVRFLGIKRLGLPESVTQKIFERMKQERQRYVQRLNAEGEALAKDINSAALRQRDETLAKAEAQAREISGQADLEVAKSLYVFKENPDLAVFLLKIDALEESLKDRSTLILDQRTPPFDLLDGAAKNNLKPAALSPAK